MRLDPVRFAYVSQPTVASLTSSQPSQLPPCQGNNISIWSNCVGTEVWPDGEKYVGEYLNGKKIGQGTLTWASGNKYVGEFRNNRQHGQGTYTYANGSKYVGEFRDGYLDGQGTFTWADGAKYVGEYKENKKSGRAMVTYADGSWYAGNYQNDKRHGWGVYTFASKVQYVGEFKNGDFNGMGIEYNPDRTIRNSGRFENDKLVESTRLDPVRFAYVSQPSLATVKPAPTPTPVTSAANTEEQRRQAAEIERLRLEAERAREDKRRAEEALATVKQQQLQQSVSKSTAERTQVAMSTGRRRALVIGNDTYRLIPKLVNAREDAKALSESLTSVGYQVTLKLDLTEKEMKAALRTFAAQVEGGDEVVVFFAGHGVQIGSANFLLPVDIAGDNEAQVKDEAIQLQRILDDMTERKARFTLAMIDACRDNPFKGTGRSIGGRGLASTTAATGQMVIFSAGAGQQALDKLGPADKNRNGLFTRIFLKEMQKPGVSVDKVVRNVRAEVVELAKSVGHEQVPAIYDQVVGEFYFKK
jgi:hypothetical protein